MNPSILKSCLVTLLLCGTSSIVNAQTLRGNNSDNSFPGTLTGSTKYIGKGGFDQVDYDGAVSSYGFERLSSKKVRVKKENGRFDTLIKMEGAWFKGQEKFYSYSEIFDSIDFKNNITVYEGTTSRDTYLGFLSGKSAYRGQEDFDQVNYQGSSSDYVFQEASNAVTVTKPSGEIDNLQSIEGIYFLTEDRYYDIEDLFGGPVDPVDPDPVDPDPEEPRPSSMNRLTHFGQSIQLVGANLAWSDDNRFSSDFGRSDGRGNPDLNVSGFQAQLDDISNSGGNSARIWVHTTAQVTPNIASNGRTVGLSRELSNAQVIQQLKDVLDDAWDRGVLVTFSLFSFDMLCDNFQNDFGYSGTMIRNRKLLTNRRDDYFNNALIPMIEGLKDHPALFAWEVFNEAEGMYSSTTFCSEGATFGINANIAASFVNEAAAVIHKADPNVKVTTSTNTDIFRDFTNQKLTSGRGADPTGTLDFYELHWYNTGWNRDPYSTKASDYNLDKPIIMGEFDLDSDVTAISRHSPADAITEILRNGYAGAWPWSLQTANVRTIRDAISNANTPMLDKQAIERCIRDKPANCYNGERRSSGLSAQDVDAFAFAGQSNAEGHFSNADGNRALPTGAQAFADRIQSLTGFPTETINAATGGTHSNNIPDSGNPLFWWNSTTDQPTRILTDAVSAIQGSLDRGQTLDGLIWAQGESDAVSIYYSDAGFTRVIQNEFADATVKIFQHFRDAFGADLPIYVQQLNDFDIPGGATFPRNKGFRLIRREQDKIIRNQANTYLGATTLRLPQRDALHFNTASQNNIAEQLAEKVIEIESEG